MALNKEKFIKNFLVETRENLTAADDTAIELEKNPREPGLLNRILRALHTIKGSSRMLGFQQMEHTAHALENIFKGCREERYSFDSTLLQLVLLGTQTLRRGLQAVQTSGTDAIETELLRELCQRAADNEPFANQIPRLREKLRMEEGESQQHSGGSGSPGDSSQGDSGASPAQAGRYDTIRIDLSDIQDITATLNNSIISQFQLKQFQQRIQKLQENASEANQKEIQGFQKDFTEQMAMVEQNSYKLQEKIMRLSMLPVDLVLGELPRMVAETSAILKKEIDLETAGGEILLDKVVLEKLNDPLIHILRNAVDHGIEPPEEREKKGKPRRGSIQVACTAEGGHLTLRIQDDGGGVDRDQIIRRAVEAGLTTGEEAEELTDTEVYSFIFQPGFSSRTEVSDLSGRGVGLDIVKVNVESVKGKVTVRSTPGEGTEFILSVPLSLATVSGFFVKAGGEKFLIPSNFVYRIVRISRSEVIEYLHKEAFYLNQEIIPLYSLNSLLSKPSERRGKDLYVTVVESMGERIGIIVDDVLQHVSLIYKPVPKNSQKLSTLQGIVFDENYHIITILFVPELMSRFRRIKSIDLVSEDLAEHKQAPVILVVDDSLNTREIEQSILEMEGYTVKTATDGIEGLEILRTSRADMVVTDVDMPRMDGITMTENLRKNADLGDIPVVVITASDDPETASRIRRSGADAHIIKSDFNRNSLIDITRQLLKKEENPAREEPSP